MGNDQVNLTENVLVLASAAIEFLTEKKSTTCCG